MPFCIETPGEKFHLCFSCWDWTHVGMFGRFLSLLQKRFLDSEVGVGAVISSGRKLKTGKVAKHDRPSQWHRLSYFGGKGDSVLKQVCHLDCLLCPPVRPRDGRRQRAKAGRTLSMNFLASGYVCTVLWDPSNRVQHKVGWPFSLCAFLTSSFSCSTA